MTEATVQTHTCPNCAGPLLFDPTSQLFHCEYCLSTFHEEEVSKLEATQQSTAEKETTEDIGVFVCPNCAAEIVTEATTAATTCYYCHSPVVLTTRLDGKFLPEKVLPFKISKEEACQKFLAWSKKKKFVPTAFFSQEQIKNLQGVYLPYWVVQAQLNGQLQATGTKVRVWCVGDLEYTETKQFQIFRRGDIFFKDFIKNALQKNETKKMVETIQPFLLEEAIPFKNQYLSGFSAEKRDVEFADIEEKVADEFKKFGEALLSDTMDGYTTVTGKRGSYSIVSEEKDYLLLPLWIITYKEKGREKLYYYAMNGQTGKTAGILPVSIGKLCLASMGIALAVLLAGLIVGWFI